MGCAVLNFVILHYHGSIITYNIMLFPWFVDSSGAPIEYICNGKVMRVM